MLSQGVFKKSSALEADAIDENPKKNSELKNVNFDTVFTLIS
jgi:hypothetical protein